jgi:hypothetical protein
MATVVACYYYLNLGRRSGFVVRWTGIHFKTTHVPVIAHRQAGPKKTGARVDKIFRVTLCIIVTAGILAFGRGFFRKFDLAMGYFFLKRRKIIHHCEEHSEQENKNEYEIYSFQDLANLNKKITTEN